MGVTGRLAVFLILVCAAGAAAQAEVPGTYGEVQRWYRTAAEAGDPHAQLLLGRKYETGTDFPKDEARAADWYERAARQGLRSEEHTSELQSLMRISYAVFCLKTKKKQIYML